MKNIRCLFLLFLLMPANALLSTIHKDQNKILNYSVVNVSNQDIAIRVQFNKIFDLGFTGVPTKENARKYFLKKQIRRAVNYILLPNQEIKMYDAFIKANPLSAQDEYWLPTNLTISASDYKAKKDLEIKINDFNMLDYDLIKQRKYSVKIINNELQVETENVLVPR